VTVVPVARIDQVMQDRNHLLDFLRLRFKFRDMVGRKPANIRLAVLPVPRNASSALIRSIEKPSSRFTKRSR
jgi:hypothetical protein